MDPARLRSVDESTGPKVLKAKIPVKPKERVIVARVTPKHTTTAAACTAVVSTQAAPNSSRNGGGSSSLDEAEHALAEGTLSPAEFQHIAGVNAAAARLETEHVTKSTGITNEEVAASDEEGRKHIDWSPSISNHPRAPEVASLRSPRGAPLLRSPSLQQRRLRAGAGAGPTPSPHSFGSSLAQAVTSPTRAVIANYFDPSAREAADSARRTRWRSELLAFIRTREGGCDSSAGSYTHGDENDDDLLEKRAEEAFSGGVQECQMTTLLSALEMRHGASPPSWAEQLQELRAAWEVDLPAGDSAIVLPGDDLDAAEASAYEEVGESGATAASECAKTSAAARGANALAQLVAFYFVFNRQKLDHLAAKVGDTLPRGSAAAVLLRAYGIGGLTPKLRDVYCCAPAGWEALAAHAAAKREASSEGTVAGSAVKAAQVKSQVKQKHQDERWARMEKFKGDMRLHQEHMLENAMIKWRRKNPSGTWEAYLKSECSGNIKTDKHGATVWIDSRTRQLEHMFKAVRAHTTLHKICEAPAPPETDDIDKQEKEFAALFPGGGF